MRIFRGFERLPVASRGLVAAIGNFDGIHLGHQVVMDAAKMLASKLSVPWGLVTFEPHPKDVLFMGDKLKRLTPLRRKFEILRSDGCTQLMVLPFSSKLIALSAERFVSSVLHEQYGLVGIVSGEDFRFGHKRAGDVHLLSKLANKLDIEANAVPTRLVDGMVCSSTAIRQHLIDGSVELANRQLGRAHQIVGVIRPGDQRGRQLGFATANTYPMPANAAMPGTGIYIVSAKFLDRPDDPWMGAVASLGRNPTFAGDEVRLEVHILDREFDDLYGRKLRVAFHKRLRGEVAYTTIDALVAQIEKDCDQARRYLALPGGHRLPT